jgi:hypothetical protein
MTIAAQTEITLTLSGHLRVVVRSRDAELAGQIASIFAAGQLPAAQAPSGPGADAVYEIEPPGAGEGGKYTVWLNGDDVYGTASRNTVLWYLDSAITDRLNKRLTGYSLFHSGFVRYKGRGILLPGESGAGKSTTIAALAMSGAAFYSDEIAVVDGSHTVWPYPRALALKPGGWRAISEAFPDLTARGAISEGTESPVWYVRPPVLAAGADGPARVDCIVLPRRAPGEAAKLTPVAKSAAISTLVRQSLDLKLKGKAGFEVIVALAQQADCYSLTVPDVHGTLAALEALAQHT